MAINYDNFFINRNNNIKRKKQFYFQTLPNEPKMSEKINKSNDTINNSYFNTFNNKNKIKKKYFFTAPITNSFNYNVNKTQGIIGYNNYIINGNNFNNISFNESIKQNNFNYSGKNNFNVGLSNYLKISKFNTANNTLNNTSISFINNSNYNNDVDYLNMKLNFKILQQKLSHLNNIVKPNYRYINKTLNESNNDSFFKNEYSIKDKSNDYYNHKLEKYLKTKNNESFIIEQKKENLTNNLKNFEHRNKIKNHINIDKSVNLKYEKKDLNIQKIIKKIYQKKLFIKNNDYKESDNLSEIADDIIDIINENNKNNDFYIKTNNKKNCKTKEIIKNKFINNKQNKIKNVLKKQHNNSIDITKFNKMEYSISNLPHIIYSPDKKKKSELIVEHVFAYNHHDNLNKSIKLNNIDNNIYTNKEKANNNNENLNKDNSEENADEEGERIINSILARASNIKKCKENDEENKIIVNDKKNNDNLNSFENIIGKINENLIKKQKKVTFDQNLIFINYDQNNKITNLNIKDSKNKSIKFIPKDIYKYLKNIKYNKNKVKPIILNSNITDCNNKEKDINENNKKNQKRNITKRNIDYLKIVKKRGTIYNISKEKKVKKLENKNCKKFSENPQNFFTEDLCDNILVSYNLKPKKNSRNSSSEKKRK